MFKDIGKWFKCFLERLRKIYSWITQEPLICHHHHTPGSHQGTLTNHPGNKDKGMYRLDLG